MNIFKRVIHKDQISDAAKAEIADSYRTIVSTIAWRDLEKFLDSIEENSNKDIDAIQISELTLSEIGRSRGLREAVNKIRSHVDYLLNGSK
jgi:hypothetical protein